MMQCLSSAHGVREAQAQELQFLALKQIWTALSLVRRVPMDPTNDPTASGVDTREGSLDFRIEG
jgi:hypothetical protein